MGNQDGITFIIGMILTAFGAVIFVLGVVFILTGVGVIKT